MQVIVERRNDLKNKVHYKLDCRNCGSTLDYVDSDVNNGVIQCPICGITNESNKGLSLGSYESAVTKTCTCNRCKNKFKYTKNDIVYSNSLGTAVKCPNCNKLIGIIL